MGRIKRPPPPPSRARKQTDGNLRLVDAAVVEDKIHAGELFSRLLGFEVELHHPFVTCPTQTQIHTEKCKKKHGTSLQGAEFLRFPLV